MAVSSHLFEDIMATYHPPGGADHSPSAEKHVRIGVGSGAREGPNTQHRAGHLIVVCSHFFEDMDGHLSSTMYLALSFGKETRVRGVGHGSPRGSEHSGPSWASHCGPSPPLRGHDGHLSSTWYCWRDGW